MPSQKSIPSALAREPKRLRGKRRVEALLDAAAWAFGEKGYDGATMTEIAARADTAIGSLYQFFPSKEALADALLTRYGERLEAGLQQIESRAAALGPAGLAAALVDLMLELRGDRASAIALLEARDVAGVSRAALRQMMLRQLSASLLAAGPAIGVARAQTMSFVLLHAMKAIPRLAAEGEAAGTDVVGEVRSMIRLYIVHALGKP
jgi:AcrR family transcriptional regulator